MALCRFPGSMTSWNAVNDVSCQTLPYSQLAHYLTACIRCNLLHALLFFNLRAL